MNTFSTWNTKTPFFGNQQSLVLSVKEAKKTATPSQTDRDDVGLLAMILAIFTCPFTCICGFFSYLGSKVRTSSGGSKTRIRNQADRYRPSRPTGNRNRNQSDGISRASGATGSGGTGGDDGDGDENRRFQVTIGSIYRAFPPPKTTALLITVVILIGLAIVYDFVDRGTGGDAMNLAVDRLGTDVNPNRDSKAFVKQHKTNLHEIFALLAPVLQSAPDPALSAVMTEAPT